MITGRLLVSSARHLARTVISLCVVFRFKHSLLHGALWCPVWTPVNSSSALPPGSPLGPASRGARRKQKAEEEKNDLQLPRAFGFRAPYPGVASSPGNTCSSGGDSWMQVVVFTPSTERTLSRPLQSDSRAPSAKVRCSAWQAPLLYFSKYQSFHSPCSVPATLREIAASCTLHTVEAPCHPFS